MKDVLAVSDHDDAGLVRQCDAVFDVPTATIGFRARWFRELDDALGCVHILPIVERELCAEFRRAQSGLDVR